MSCSVSIFKTFLTRQQQHQMIVQTLTPLVGMWLLTVLSQEQRLKKHDNAVVPQNVLRTRPKWIVWSTKCLPLKQRPLFESCPLPHLSMVSFNHDQDRSLTLTCSFTTQRWQISKCSETLTNHLFFV